MGGAVEVFELTRFHGPQEGAETERAKEQRRRDQVDQYAHVQPSIRASLRRNAFAVTISDDDDIAIAAIKGVANPNIAKGIATAL